MLMVNIADHPVRTDEFGGLEVPPGGTVDIEDGYCRSKMLDNGSRRLSIVEQILPTLEPADESLRKTWREPAPAMKPEPTPEVVAKKLEEKGMPPAVAALVASGAVEQPKAKRGRRAEVQ